MKIYMPLICMCLVRYGAAQNPDTSARLAASYFNELKAATAGQRIWPVDLYGPMLFIVPQTRLTYTNTPDSAGVFKQEGDVFKGYLPAELMTANTALEWQGKTWSMVLWPLPADHDDRDNSLVHESFHRIQKRLGLPDRNPSIAHLGTMNGRIYLLLELQALKAALAKPVNERADDLTNALLFRRKRAQLFPATFADERLLEMNEGLAEYTGVILGRPHQSIRAHLYREIDSTAIRKSLIRSVAYVTGPVYGYLLYEKSPGWTLKIDSNDSFPGLVEHYYRLKPVSDADDARLKRVEGLYHYTEIAASEKQREAKRLQTARDYTALFTQGPVVTIKLIKMNIGFNPSNLFDLGELGTVYPTARIRDEWGQLDVSSEGMLLKDWQVVTVSAKDMRVNGKEIDGSGWKLVLNNGWQLRKSAEGRFEVAKE